MPTPHRHRPRVLLPGALLVAGALLGAGCGDDSDDGQATTTGGADPAEVTADGISPERCEQNRGAGTITYLSSFDFAAAASIVDVVVADEQGYFDDLCLDVELRSNFSAANYPLVASGQAQFSSAGSFTELLNFSSDGARFVALVDYGKVPIEALLVPAEGDVHELADLEGATIGVKADIPPSIVALLNGAGLERGVDYDEALLDGYDPRAHLQQGVDALPVYKSNEPGQLDAAGVEYRLFDPADEGILGTFGILYTSAEFVDRHPTAAQDFVRAALKGMEDAAADPAAAVAASLERIDAAGNERFLTQEGETYRWEQELALVRKGTPEGEPLGLVDPELLAAEVAAYDAAGVFPDGAPDPTGSYEENVARDVYDDDGKVIWPTG